MCTMNPNLGYTEASSYAFPKIYKCKTCPYSTKFIYFMHIHIKRHVVPPTLFDCRGNIELFYCQKCTFKTDVFTYFKKHLIERHAFKGPPVQITNYVCTKCGLVTYSSFVWLKHTTRCLRSFLYNQSRPVPKKPIEYVKCHQCPHLSRGKCQLKRHELTEHSTMDTKWIQCEKCPFQSKTLKGLSVHNSLKHVVYAAVQDADIMDISQEFKNISEEHSYASKRFYCDSCALESYLPFQTSGHKSWCYKVKLSLKNKAEVADYKVRLLLKKRAQEVKRPKVLKCDKVFKKINWDKCLKLGSSVSS